MIITFQHPANRSAFDTNAQIHNIRQHLTGHLHAQVHEVNHGIPGWTSLHVVAPRDLTEIACATWIAPHFPDYRIEAL